MDKKDGWIIGLAAYALLITLGWFAQWSEKNAWRRAWENQAAPSQATEVEAAATALNQRMQAKLQESRERLEAVRRGEQVGPPSN